jgi:hypothetical protein
MYFARVVDRAPFSFNVVFLHQFRTLLHRIRAKEDQIKKDKKSKDKIKKKRDEKNRGIASLLISNRRKTPIFLMHRTNMT